MWHLDSWSRLYTGIAHLPDRVDRFAAYWVCSRATRIGGKEGNDIGMHGAAKDERQADGGRQGRNGWRREATLDDAYIRLKLIGIVPLADISYLLVRGSFR